MPRHHAWALTCALMCGCGTMTAADAGLDSGSGSVVDAGFDAGPPPLCLPDRVDAGSDDAGWDGGYDFSCRGLPRPSGGQAELIITGKTTKAGLTRTGLPGVLVELLDVNGRVVSAAFSEDGGAYRLSFDAGCQSLDGRVRATSLDPDAGYAIAFAVPDAPWRYDRSGLELVMFDPSTQGLAALFASVALVDGTSALAFTVEDCAGNSVAGAQVSIAGDAGDVRYVGQGGLPSSMLTSTSSSGDVIIFNVSGTSATIRATLDGGVIAERTLAIEPRTVIGTFLTP